MHFLFSIADAFLAWAITVTVLVLLLFKEKLPAEEGNMAFYLLLQAAIPLAVFYWTYR